MGLKSGDSMSELKHDSGFLRLLKREAQGFGWRMIVSKSSTAFDYSAVVVDKVTLEPVGNSFSSDYPDHAAHQALRDAIRQMQRQAAA